jgi:hypothetical protein
MSCHESHDQIDCSKFAKSLSSVLQHVNLSSSALCYTVLALLLWLLEPALVSISLHRPCYPLLHYHHTIGQYPSCIHAGVLDTARGIALSQRQHFITTRNTGNMIAVSTGVCLQTIFLRLTGPRALQCDLHKSLLVLECQCRHPFTHNVVGRPRHTRIHRHT